MCSVACGRAELMYEVGFGGPWDCAAAALIVTEAGGQVGACRLPCCDYAGASSIYLYVRGLPNSQLA